MTDQELADKVVALGVGIASNMPHQLGIHYRLDDAGFTWRTVEQFVRDWRVSGALMEKTDNGSWSNILIGAKRWSVVADGPPVTINDSLPRAIIEAYVETLSNDNRSKK